MKLYDFTRLINKYSVEFCLHQTQGSFVAGKWEQGGERVKKMRGAIVPMKDKKLYDSGGTYTSKDRELYLTQPLRGDLSSYNVVYRGNAYAVEEGRNFEDYADAAIYVLKWQSKKVGEHESGYPCD